MPRQKSRKSHRVLALSGVTIRVHGFMVPLGQAKKITKFALVTTLVQRDWEQPPLIQETIVVTCPPGKSVDYSLDEIIVQGKLSVDIMKDDGFIVGIFDVNAAKLETAPK